MDQILPTGGSFTLIHLVYPLSDDSPPEWRIACMPNLLPSEFHRTSYHQSQQRTDATAAVTCPACKRTEVYMRLAGIKLLPKVVAKKGHPDGQ